jgi:hypothetical protein
MKARPNFVVEGMTIDDLDAVAAGAPAGGPCHFCARPCSPEDFCFGCRHLVCPACDPPLADDAPAGEHEVEEHKLPDNMWGDHDWDYFDDEGNGVCKRCHAVWARYAVEPPPPPCVEAPLAKRPDQAD